MMLRRARSLAVRTSVLLLTTGCAADPIERAPVEDLRELAAPVGAGSGQPNLFAVGERVYLSWIEPEGEESHALRFAVWEGGYWSAAHTIARGSDFFVNWADFPSLSALSDGTLAAHWLVRSGSRSYDYDVHLALSRDSGRSWGGSLVPHRDGTQSEHGFVSLFPWSDGSLAAAWLDGREMAGGEEAHDGHGGPGAMTLRHTTLSAAGELGPEVVLDERTCECCQTAAAITSRGPVVVYRDRSPEEVRDISVVRHAEGRWSEPRPVHQDGWQITGCPVNGPAVAAEGERVAVAWFTAAQEEPRVLLAFSDDAGGTFGAPARVDDGDPVGRVAVLLLEDGSALVSWLESVGEGAEVRVRRIAPDGGRGPAATVASSSAARASGFPRMVRMGEQLVFAWTQPGDPGSVQVAAARLAAF